MGGGVKGETGRGQARRQQVARFFLNAKSMGKGDDGDKVASASDPWTSYNWGKQRQKRGRPHPREDRELEKGQTTAKGREGTAAGR